MATLTFSRQIGGSLGSAAFGWSRWSRWSWPVRWGLTVVFVLAAVAAALVVAPADARVPAGRGA